MVVPAPGTELAVISPPWASDELPGDGQPQSGAVRIVALHEPVEDVGDERRIDAGARVADLEVDPAAVRGA